MMNDTKKTIKLHDELHIDENKNCDINDLSVENMILLRMVLQTVGEQITTIVVDALEKFSNFTKQNQIDILNLKQQIDKLSCNMKDLQTCLNNSNSHNIEWKENSNKNYFKLKQDMKKMEKELKDNMKQQQKEMMKIDKLFKSHLNIDKSIINSLNADCARMVDNHRTIARGANQQCTRITEINSDGNDNNVSINGIWNNFNKMEYFASNNNFHGKFLLTSNDYNIFDEISLLNFCNDFGLISDVLTSIFWRMEFLKIVKLNNFLSVTLFSHYYNKNNSGSKGSRSNTHPVNKWFKRRWKKAQRL